MRGVIAGAIGALAAIAAAAPGAPMLCPEPPRIAVPHSARIPGPKRKQPGHPFRTRDLKLDDAGDRERRFIEAVSSIASARRKTELTDGQKFVAMQEFRRGSSAHHAYRCIRWPA